MTMMMILLLYDDLLIHCNIWWVTAVAKILPELYEQYWESVYIPGAAY